MVERMRKLSLLLYHQSRDAFLSGLQELGVVQLEADHVVESPEIKELDASLSRLKKAWSRVEVVAGEFAKNSKKKKAAELSAESLEDFCGRIESLDTELAGLLEGKQTLEKEAETLELWGEFDPELLNQLKTAGIGVKFASARAKAFDTNAADLSAYGEIARVKGMVYFVLFDGSQSAFPEWAAPETVPLKRLSELREEISRLDEKILGVKHSIAAWEVAGKWMESEKAKLSDELSYLVAEGSLSPEAEGSLLIVQGYFPYRREKALLRFLDSQDAVYTVADPAPDENVPVELRNNAFAKLFEPITKMHSLPLYNELDPTPFFAPFFAFFFGMCMADAGYGLVLLVATVIATIMVKNKALRSICILGIILSLMTFICGILFNSFFGTEVLKLPIPPEWKALVSFKDMNASMSFAILLGVIQVLLGFVMQIVNKIKAGGLLAGLQPLGTFLLICGTLLGAVMVLMTGDLSIGPIPVKKWLSVIPNPGLVSIVLLGVGLFLVLFFNNLNQKIFLRPLLGLWEVYGIVTGIPGDILSYLRLFALGLAGGLLGSAFNQIALMARGDTPSVVGIVAMVAIMLVGHTLNLLLAILGAFVHPLRLTLLEFYKSSGFSGGGRAYQPLHKEIVLKNK